MKRGFVLWMALMLLLVGCSSAPVQNTGKTEIGSEAADGGTSGEKTDIEGTLPTYLARIQDWSLNEEEIAIALFGGGEYEQLYDGEGQFFNDRRFLSYAGPNGKMLSLDSGAMTYYTPQVDGFPHAYFWGNIIMESNQYSPYIELFPEGVEVVFPEMDLWFMSLDDARELTKKYLDILSVEYGEDWVCYAVPSDRLNEVRKAEYPDDPTAWNYTEEDERYCFQIPLMAGGKLLTTRGVKVDNSMMIQGSYARAMVGSSGLWFLEVWMPFEVVSESASQPIITEESAMTNAREWYSQLLGTGKVELESQGIQYVAHGNKVRNAEAFELTPAWIIKATFEDGTKNLLAVDAYTGERR